jgi:hypothetical protein
MAGWTLKQVQGDGGGVEERRGSSQAVRWNRALAGLAAAEAALAAASGEPDEVYDPIGARHEVAFQRLLRTPAPDAAALAHKLELALDERAGEFFGDEAAMKAIKRDAWRIAASLAEWAEPGPSPVKEGREATRTL